MAPFASSKSAGSSARICRAGTATTRYGWSWAFSMTARPKRIGARSIRSSASNGTRRGAGLLAQADRDHLGEAAFLGTPERGVWLDPSDEVDPVGRERMTVDPD